MFFRMIGTVVTLAIILYLMGSYLSSDKQLAQKVNANPAMQEQQKALKDQGIDATDQKALQQYTIDQAKQIQEYQNQQVPK